MIIHRGYNEFFDGSEAHYTKSKFNNLYLAKEFEKGKSTDLVKMIREDWPDPEFKK